MCLQTLRLVIIKYNCPTALYIIILFNYKVVFNLKNMVAVVEILNTVGKYFSFIVIKKQKKNKLVYD